MNFLAVDTSSARLVVAAYKGGKAVVRGKESALRHSVLLMDEIDAALTEADLSLGECDFIACAVGPGSFTGIRIGISAVKGLCFASSRPALAVTSFDPLAYADTSGERIVLIDAGHGAYYARTYGENAGEPMFVPAAKVEEAVAGRRIVTDETADRAQGLIGAVLALSNMAGPADRLAALYLRASAAEEGR